MGLFDWSVLLLAALLFLGRGLDAHATAGDTHPIYMTCVGQCENTCCVQEQCFKSCSISLSDLLFCPHHGAYIFQGATIADKTVAISLDPDYKLQPAASALVAEGQNDQSALRKAEDVVSNMLAKGFILGKDAVGKAKKFDEKHQLTSTASLKIASLDQKIGFTDKISMGTSAVNNKVKEMDEKFQVSEKTKTAFAVAEEKVSNAGSAIMKNRYVLTGATWVTGAFNKVAKAAGEVGQKTKQKVGMVEGEQKQRVVDDFTQVHLSESDSPKADTPKASSSPKSSSPVTNRCELEI